MEINYPLKNEADLERGTAGGVGRVTMFVITGRNRRTYSIIPYRLRSLPLLAETLGTA